MMLLGQCITDLDTEDYPPQKDLFLHSVRILRPGEPDRNLTFRTVFLGTINLIS